MLYPYTAAMAFELSLPSAAVVEVAEQEDEAGWVKVKTEDGRVGLVPGSYLQMGGAMTSKGEEAGQAGREGESRAREAEEERGA